jgi:hypothetical protein
VLNLKSGLVFFANKTGSYCDGQGRLEFLGEEAFQERVVSNAKVNIFLEKTRK